MKDLLKSKLWLSELLWLLLSAIFSLLLVFTFFKVTSVFGDTSFGIGDTYFIAETSVFFFLVYAAIGSWTFIMRAFVSKFKNAVQVIFLALFIGLSIYLLHQALPADGVNKGFENDGEWILYAPFSSLSFQDKLGVLGDMFLQGVWTVWLYFGLIMSFIGLLGRLFWLSRRDME
ncbi:hypothetical protein OB69_11205 [Roseivirga seohaensis subsp. aquiponti]|uniref:Uncharacterized protein n=1 Tax=Roseivirga seohaensis subsp. aquiponti TaxID=1566026 RepID=A0A0L8AKC8_9BACT|nr:hypothetical protein [Roseivirga seohaensis]KOF02849.1 hypothetical protein OB69_11205 [Roseivirga seohaensis subsp. aquiponti]|tara:strand:- start:51 stop:572 length:522 start_codon:yes stop_codon:yes gene_type:complete